MKLKYFLTNSHEHLRDNIAENLSKYNRESSWIDSYFNEPFDVESPIDVTLPGLITSSKSSDDLDNVIALYSDLIQLSDEQAMDARLWVHLTHIEYWEYMQKRWPVDSKYFEEKGTEGDDDGTNKKPITRVTTRYFMSANTDNCPCPQVWTTFLVMIGVSFCG